MRELRMILRYVKKKINVLQLVIADAVRKATERVLP